MSLAPAARRIRDLCISSFVALALASGPPAGAAGTSAGKPTADSLVKRPAPAKAPAYAKPKVEKKVAKSQGAAAEREWTVMYYLDADCDLEPPMLDDLDEMEMVGATDAVNILALVDRSPGYETRDGNWSNSRLLFVTHDQNPGRLDSKLLNNLQELDTADPRTLVEFVAFGIQNFPAKRYALILGNHGGTWMGMLNDETDNPEGMKLAPFVEGLAALQAAGAPKLDLAVFDMCLMAQVEVMDAIAPYVAYGVASEELEPGMGYPNHRVLHQLARNPKMSAREFATSMVREWGASYAEVGEATVTSSATDLSKMGGVVAAVDALAVALMKAPEEVRAAAARARAATHRYGADSAESLASYDLGEFAALLSGMPEAAPIQPQLEAVKAAVRDAVVEHNEGAAHLGSTGLAIYFPAGEVHREYASVPLTRTQWDELLAGGLAGGGAAAAGGGGAGPGGGGAGGGAASGPGGGGGTAGSGAAGVTIASPDPGQSHELGDGFQISGEVHGSPIALVAAIGYQDQDGGFTLVSQEEVRSADARETGNGTVVSSWSHGEGFTYDLRPRVRAISDGKNARLAPLTPLSPGNRYARSVASYNSMMGDLEVAPIFDTKTGELETVFCKTEGGANASMSVHPVKGEKLVFYQTASAGAGKEERLRPVPALTVPGGAKAGPGGRAGGGKAAGGSGLRLVDTGLPAGNYVLALTAYDGAGRPAGQAHLAFTAGGAGVAPGVAYPDYGLPSIDEDDLAYVDLTQIIPADEYDQFEATWEDYDFMAFAESDDLSAQDLVWLEETALTEEEIEFDEANWSDEFDEESIEHDGDIDNDGTPDEADADDDGDGIPDDADEDADGDSEPDATEEDFDDDGTPDDEEPELDDDGTPEPEEEGDDSDEDGTPDDEDTDDDNDGTPDEQDLDDDGDGTTDEDEGGEEEDPGDEDPGDDGGEEELGDEDPGDDGGEEEDPGDEDPGDDGGEEEPEEELARG